MPFSAVYDPSIVSVIIPARNAEASLEASVASAFAQTRGVLEVIVIEDDSTDKTLEVAEALGRRHERLRVLRNEQNLGPAASRNRGIDAASGDWIALLDADDEWLPQRLEKLSVHFPGADAVADDLRMTSPNQRGVSLLRSRGLKLAAPVTLDFMDVASYQLGLLKPVIRKSFLDAHRLRFDPSLRIGEDFCLFIELLLAEARWVQLPDAYYSYTRADDSLTSDSRRHIEGSIRFNQALLSSASVRAEPGLVAILERRERWLRDFAQLVEAGALVRDRKWRALGRLLAADRRAARVLVQTAARHAYHKLVPYPLRKRGVSDREER
jgi:succinoglycan biosynthesis protein ExoO